jgi:peptidyl-prolyl cis-trans isomerase-like 4
MLVEFWCAQIGDLPDADVKPPENVLFICKLNPATVDEDLELIFSQFGAIHKCEACFFQQL